MTKTTIEGWSLSKHSEFVKKVDGKRFRPIRQKQRSLRAELSQALGNYQHKDIFSYYNAEMLKTMSSKDDWYKYKRGEFE